jgi:hypothetical protein
MQENKWTVVSLKGLDLLLLLLFIYNFFFQKGIYGILKLFISFKTCTDTTLIFMCSLQSAPEDSDLNLVVFWLDLLVHFCG